MRGKGVSFAYAEALAGITPAYAGKSMTRFISHRHTTDHPRLCGEKIWVKRFNDTGEGSPPPMRGKVQWISPSAGNVRITPAYAGKSEAALDAGFSFFGITPAYAGKSQARPQQADTSEDHPRLCGEKYTLKFKTP